ncbi:MULTISPECIES: hypothetical protein [unclassified Serratia (in: enterobacteria)]|uniref:hypothetical protein n=1 Tax=unclassified Serratia (in: enterobacteria) TaxID=2647522 RepID=UPI0030768194
MDFDYIARKKIYNIKENAEIMGTIKEKFNKIKDKGWKEFAEKAIKRINEEN